ncbi:MAG: TlpA disulfide reductase family protein, partial [Pseudoxanthomonas sp.]
TPARAAATAAAVGDLLPALVLPDLDGRSVALGEAWRGRRLLLNVWASWCRPCREEMPALDRFARRQGPQGVQVVGIALDTPDNVRAYLQRVPVAYPQLLASPGPADASVQLGDSRGLLPYSVLVGADGRIERQKLGPLSSEELERWLQ